MNFRCVNVYLKKLTLKKPKLFPTRILPNVALLICDFYPFTELFLERGDCSYAQAELGISCLTIRISPNISETHTAINNGARCKKCIALPECVLIKQLSNLDTHLRLKLCRCGRNGFAIIKQSRLVYESAPISTFFSQGFLEPSIAQLFKMQ